MDSFTAASAKRALGSLQSVRWTSDAPGFSNVHVHYAGRTGVCSNGLCEVSCYKDCSCPHPRSTAFFGDSHCAAQT